MRSIKFPKMFNDNNTRVWKPEEHNAQTRQAVMLTLLSERGELFGDPYFGLLLRHFLFNQNSYVLKDQLIEMIYTQLVLFVPQLKVERKDIKVWVERQKGRVICDIHGTNLIDYKTNSIQLVLFDQSESNK